MNPKLTVRTSLVVFLLMFITWGFTTMYANGLNQRDEERLKVSEAKYQDAKLKRLEKENIRLQSDLATIISQHSERYDTIQKLKKDLDQAREEQRRASRNSSRRTVISKTPTIFSSAAAWANTVKAIRVARCESGGDPTAVSESGTYRGKWQMDAAFWAGYGGRAFARTADRASESQQDAVAYRGWLKRGWQPWPHCGKL